jgi:hypothetical protein
MVWHRLPHLRRLPPLFFYDNDSICAVEDDDGVERDELVTSLFEAFFTALSV